MGVIFQAVSAQSTSSRSRVLGRENRNVGYAANIVYCMYVHG
jgi:hypothetical protein